MLVTLANIIPDICDAGFSEGLRSGEFEGQVNSNTLPCSSKTVFYNDRLLSLGNTVPMKGFICSATRIRWVENVKMTLIEHCPEPHTAHSVDSSSYSAS